MEPALTDLVRELDAAGLPLRETPAEVDIEAEVEVEVVDDLLLDPWFFKSEDEIAALDDDPTARIVEIKIAPLDREAFEEIRWVF